MIENGLRTRTPLISSSLNIKFVMLKNCVYNPDDPNSQDNKKIKEYEKQIDIMVYKLYELTYDEVLIVDPEFDLSREEYERF